MAGGMAGPDKKAGLIRHSVWVLALAAAMLQPASRASAQSPPSSSPLPKECTLPGNTGPVPASLPRVAAALKERKKISILAIGGTSASLRGPVSGGHYATVERFLEQMFKGLDVEVVHRGVSGELATDAANRIKNEVGLTNADLVLWQLGTADALSRAPVEDFAAAVSETLTWLREHNVDVILVGMRYTRGMASDPDYQQFRTAIQAIAKQQNVLRISRYEAEEVLEKVRKNQGVALTDAEISETDYACLAESIARSIAAGLFAKDRPPAASPPKQ